MAIDRAERNDLSCLSNPPAYRQSIARILFNGPVKMDRAESDQEFFHGQGRPWI